MNQEILWVHTLKKKYIYIYLRQPFSVHSKVRTGAQEPLAVEDWLKLCEIFTSESTDIQEIPRFLYHLKVNIELSLLSLSKMHIGQLERLWTTNWSQDYRCVSFVSLKLSVFLQSVSFVSPKLAVFLHSVVTDQLERVTGRQAGRQTHRTIRP